MTVARFELDPVGKAVLFDVTELTSDIVIRKQTLLEKPVLFDVTELLQTFTDFLFRVCWKSRFYLMSRNTRTCNYVTPNHVGKAGFI